MPTLADVLSQNIKPVENHGNFDLIKKFKLDFADINVSKWKSRTSGLSVVHLDYDAPLVSGYFVVGTEIFDDSGCPHTLEHLVFMGSEKYPYKGIIDQLANRGFSNGTNAWTDTDHTAYTVSTAGEQGFLQLLPIYVDHILYPTLTKAGFVTEVHHIDSKGEDSGVVYSEMQGRENTSGDLMALRMQRLLNPSGSAYRSETGGLMEALRVLTIEQIRKYHHTYYVPHNLTLIVAGKLASGTTTLLDVVQNQIEPTIAQHGQDKGPKPEGWKRPFMETASAERKPISETVKKTVQFPEKDETVGELLLGFLGPPPTSFLERKALDILGSYLTTSPVAPLNKEYVEVENPLCTYFYFAEDTRATYVDLPVYVGSVPTEHLDTFDEKIKASLKRIADEGLDMQRMAMVLGRDERQLRSKVESSQGELFATTVITDSLYGPEDGSELANSMDEIEQYTALKSWTNQQWVDLLRKYYVDPPCIVLRGKPSGKMADRLDSEEKARIAAQKERLGPAGLAECERVLEEAKKEHEKEIPVEVLKSFPVPDVKSISWIPVQSVQEKHRPKSRAPAAETNNAELAKHIEQDGAPLPFFVQYDHVKSDFVTINAFFSLANVPPRLGPHFTLYLSSFFALPVRRNGERLTHEEVVHKLDSDTVTYEAAIGVNGLYNNVMRVSIKVETAMYETAITWLKDLLYNSEFDKERLQVNVAKLQQQLPEIKRDGDNVLSSVNSDLLYQETAIVRMGGIVYLLEQVPKLAEQLRESPEEVIKDLELLRSSMMEPSGVRISVQGNILALKEPRSTWARHFGEKLPETELAPLPMTGDTVSDVGANPSKKAVVVSLPTIESSFVTHTTKGIRGWDHPDLPALRVALEVLNGTESFFWRYIRGSGLAYGTYCALDLEAGFIQFYLYRSSNSMEAFRQASTVIKGLTDGSIPLDETAVDAAKSSIVYGVAKSVSTPGRASLVSFINQGLKGVAQNHHSVLLEKYQKVTKEDVLAVLKKYFPPLFDSKSSVAVVVTAPGKADQISEDLGKIGFEVERKTLQAEPGEEDDSDSDGDSESESDDSR